MLFCITRYHMIFFYINTWCFFFKYWNVNILLLRNHFDKVAWYLTWYFRTVSKNLVLYRITDNGRGFLLSLSSLIPSYKTIGYWFWIASIFHSFKAICLKLWMYERFVNIFDSQKKFWDQTKISMISNTGVYTIVHYIWCK